MDRFEEIKAKDFQSLNPAKLLREKRKSLKLDDEQLKGLEDIEKRYEWNSRHFIQVADSMSRALAPGGGRGRGVRGGEPPGPPSDEAKAAMEQTRTRFREALGSVREEFELARTQSIARLKPDQVEGATKILDEANSTLLERLVKASAALPAGPPG